MRVCGGRCWVMNGTTKGYFNGDHGYMEKRQIEETEHREKRTCSNYIHLICILFSQQR